jgi:hypothetical protein
VSHEPEDRASEPHRRQNGFVSAYKELRDIIRHLGDYTCQQAVELVTDYLEQALPARDRRRFERHLRNCAACSRYVEQVRLTTDTLGRVHPAPPSGETRDALVQVFKDFHSH